MSNITKKQIKKDKKSVEGLTETMKGLTDFGKGEKYKGKNPAGKPLYSVSKGRYNVKSKIFPKGVQVKTVSGKMHQGDEGEDVATYSETKTPFGKTERRNRYKIKKSKPKKGLLESQGLY